MGKILFWFLVIVAIIFGGGYYYYTQTGYKFGLDDTFLFKDSIKIITPSFSDGGTIPSQFTCDGEDVSPEFTFNRIPLGTKSIALIMEDKNAKPPFTHWLVFNYNPEINMVDSSTAWQYGSIGTNDYGSRDYQGPCPPPNEKHRYIFKIYALNFNFEPACEFPLLPLNIHKHNAQIL